MSKRPNRNKINFLENNDKTKITNKDITDQDNFYQQEPQDNRKKRRRARKKLPPEEDYKRPEDYYRGKVLRDYAHSKSLMRIQERITKRALKLINAEPPALILDIGMGCGFSTSYMYLTNYTTVGVDLIYDMLVQYPIQELNPVNADMKYLPFRSASFDYITSISAFQWIINKIKGAEREKILKNIANKINDLLKPGGKAIIQFYPSDKEDLKEIGRNFADYGKFKGNFIIDNPDSVKQRIFLYLEKA
ncbi:MAG: class I SAM-dependent methyltransferase [Promethearchaeota archaeon]